ncbi:DNA replication/repair protein RecF [Roseococcus suduntuyensis]|uniref:DNA replication and repair protein RecF n=1 Tax=Roseococcus suduntuyensis TaxID=455361 RepID=A0A840ABR0_9PROT|nr:DNA replication/repair protein RecF [Roseococcus suduntuyensis]MBB3897704.1 DNA replication and repair protein RecF [Roseococcus suduntuyensis]
MLRLSRLRLTRFRNHAALDLRFGGRAVVLTGPNGAGKTNVLEAVSLLGAGRGLRGARGAEMAMEGAPPWAVSGHFEDQAGGFEIGTGSEEGNPDRRAWRLDGEKLRGQAELAERVATVWITPQMDRIFQDSAGGRRRFLDRLVLALEPHHAREVAAYETAMAHRNRLLADARRADPAWLNAVEDAMARHGIAAAASRRALLARLNAALEGGVAGAFPAAQLALQCPANALLDTMPALAAEEALREALRATRPRDAAAGVSLSGPHRADLLFTHAAKGVPAAQCSTGEQKALLVSTVLAHAALIARARGFAPLLLLDEVPAHLDAARRAALFEALAALPGQAFLTGTDAALFAPLAGGEYFTLEESEIRPAPLG